MDLSKGRVHIETIAATAGNVTKNITATTDKRWILISLRVTLVADATAANRVIRVEITDGTNVINVVGGGANITAGQTRSLDLHPQNYGSQFTPYENQGGGWEGLYAIERAMQLRIRILNGVAGDSYSGYLTVQEYNV